ncbi:MAG: hypothetical protein IH937_06060 [Acidobacteria bacterium]|nr:hypothetical protein [Acidobacteriota bacterium]
MAEKIDAGEALVHRPEELIYNSVYRPVDVRALLESADTRGQIRKLAVPHLFFGIKELGDEEFLGLLPHVTEEQWTGILDLDLWSGDNMSSEQFLDLERHIVQAEDPVARKLIRAADPELWELLFKRKLKIYPKVEEDEYEAEPQAGEWLETPDKNYLIILPQNSEESRLLRALIIRLYELEPAYVAILFESSATRTSIEIEEVAYQYRKSRVEEMGFQDYFEAIDIYTYFPPEEPLPEKKQEQIREVSTLPVRFEEEFQGPLLLFKAFALITNPHETQALLEELFFVCNKVLSADRASPANPERVKETIGKAVTGINLGLDWHSKGNLQKASEDLRHHYLQSFFQAGYSRLLELQRRGRELKDASGEPEPGSFLEAFLEGLLKKYPLMSEQREGKIQTRFFQTRRDLETAKEYLA